MLLGSWCRVGTDSENMKVEMDQNLKRKDGNQKKRHKYPEENKTFGTTCWVGRSKYE
jgi:hypothetical protein